MSLAALTLLALGRAGLLVVIALLLSAPLSRWLSGLRGRKASLAWAGLLIPLLTPSLLISYAYLNVALQLAPWQLGHEALYVAALSLKFVPIAVMARVLVPPSLSREAWHCYGAVAPRSPGRRIWFGWRATGAGPWIAGGLVFLLAFADFELAALWNVRSWTVALFDAQAGGLALPETLRLVAAPLLIELAVLAVVLARRRPMSPSRDPAPSRNVGGIIYLLVAAGFGGLLPMGMIAVQSATAWRDVTQHFVLGREVAASLLFAFAAATMAWLLAARLRGKMALLFAVPGLMGALVVALLLLAAFQLPPLRPAYDTPLPLLVGLIVLVLPFAILVAALLRQRAHTPARFIARQIGGAKLRWVLSVRPSFAAFGLLFYWAYFDFTASSILAPVTLTPVFVRLHNLAHYGQTSVLSTLLLSAFLTPLALLLLTGLAARLYARRDGR